MPWYTSAHCTGCVPFPNRCLGTPPPIVPTAYRFLTDALVHLRPLYRLRHIIYWSTLLQWLSGSTVMQALNMLSVFTVSVILPTNCQCRPCEKNSHAAYFVLRRSCFRILLYLNVFLLFSGRLCTILNPKSKWNIRSNIRRLVSHWPPNVKSNFALH